MSINTEPRQWRQNPQRSSFSSYFNIYSEYLLNVYCFLTFKEWDWINLSIIWGENFQRSHDCTVDSLKDDDTRTVLGIKYQFITLHINTRIPCRLKKMIWTCHIRIAITVSEWPSAGGLKLTHALLKHNRSQVVKKGFWKRSVNWIRCFHLWFYCY